MKWHLLNQHYVSLDYKNSGMCVLEEVVSSEVQLVVLLVSGTVSSKTMSLENLVRFNPTELNEEYHL